MRENFNKCKTRLKLISKNKLTHLSEKLSKTNDKMVDLLEPSKIEGDILENIVRISFWI